jgi:hypothetical protein
MYNNKKEDAFLLTHLGLGDNILCIGMTNYLCEIYKKVFVVCKEHNYNNLKMLIQNPAVELLRVIDDSFISPNYGFNKYIFDKATEKWDVYLCGSHKFDRTPIKDFPLGFYDDIKMNRKVFWTHFDCHKPKESIELYNKIKDANIEKYIIVHNLSSTGKVFDSKSIISKYAPDGKDLLVINFNINEYDKGHVFYNIAQEFINKPLSFYQDLIINAEHIFMSDSSIWCMSIQLPIKTTNCYVLSRGNVSYEHLYDENIFTTELNKRRFKQILL